MNAGLSALLNKTFHNGSNRTGTTGVDRLPARWGGGSPLNKAMKTIRGDSVVLSEPLKALRDLGVDLEGSTFVSQAQMLNFNLEFKDEHIRSLSSNGYYDYSAQSLQVDFSFHSAMTVKDELTGAEHQEIFQFNFHMEVSRVQVEWGDRKVEKEDILHFAQRILNKISKLRSEGKEIDGLELNTEDLQELGAVDEGRLLKNIMAIINLLRSMDHMHGKNGDHVRLAPERHKAVTEEAGNQLEMSSKMSLSVQRISASSVLAESGALAASPVEDGS